MLSETEKAWMAGFTDGEGCITICCQIRKNRPSPSHRVFIAISNTRKIALDIFKSNYKGEIYETNEKRKNKAGMNWANAWGWYCPVSSSLAFLNDILPYLKIKREQALIALEFINMKQCLRERRPTGRWGGSSSLIPAELEKREKLRIRIQLLNAKGKLYNQVRLNEQLKHGK